jgi:hypothetical protein
MNARKPICHDKASSHRPGRFSKAGFPVLLQELIPQSTLPHLHEASHDWSIVCCTSTLDKAHFLNSADPPGM